METYDFICPSLTHKQLIFGQTHVHDTKNRYDRPE